MSMHESEILISHFKTTLHASLYAIPLNNENDKYRIFHEDGHRCRAFLEQTVVRRGSSVFCVSKSSEAERERMKPLERNERVCEEESDADALIMLIPIRGRRDIR
jgi:hypothetical protein